MKRMKYLISCGPGIGDIIQYLPLARCIKESDSKNSVDLIVSGDKNRIKSVQELLGYQNYIDEIYYYAKNELLHDIRVLFILFLKQYDYGILRVDNSTGRNWTWIEKIMYLIRCKRVVGNVKSFGNDFVPIPQYIHYLDKCSLIAQKLAIPFVAKDNNIDIDKLPSVGHLYTDSEKAKIVIGISVGTNSVLWKENGKAIFYDVKSWPLKKWMDLSSRLICEDIIVILLGGKKERNEVEDNQIDVPASALLYNCIGRTTIGESLSLLRKCDLVVGAEGGMLHCANTLGIKTLTVFGGSDYKQWNPGGKSGEVIALEPDCYPCFGTRNAAFCKYHRCLELITVEMVKDKIMEIIKNQKESDVC